MPRRKDAKKAILENSKPKTKNSKLPIIVGPTGVGKSEIAYQLAQKLKAEIISADAFQVFSGMEVGTAQPSKEWQKKIPHHLIGVRKPSQNWNAVEFAREARTIIDQKAKQAKPVLIVGGAGFYLRALISGPPQGDAPSSQTREEVQSQVREMGNEKAHEWLANRDPKAAGRIHVNDTMRICRALEKTFTKPLPGAEPLVASDYVPLGAENVRFIGLERSRENLDLLLQSRATAMWDKGLLDETRNLLTGELPETSPLWGAIGYAEAAAFIRGEITQPEAIEKIFRRSRQYAKRQWTWFKHQHQVDWVNLDEFPDIRSAVDELERHLEG